MKKSYQRYFAIAAASSLFALSLPVLAEPLNLDVLKKELVQYHDSGKYYSNLNSVAVAAQNYLAKRIAQNAKLKQPKKLAVVFDIDETSLSNYNDMKKLDFGGTIQMIDQAEARADDPAIPSTLKLYQFAKQNKVAIFFITGRYQQYRQATITNLHKAGYTSWTGLYLKPNNYNEASVVPYKAGARQLIEKQGYDIVLDIGDQYSDLEGGYTDKMFKLSDPYYFIP